MKTLCVLIALAIAFMGGWFCAIDACNAFVKKRIPVVQPQQEPKMFLRYGGGKAFEAQMKAIEELGRQRFVAEWDTFQVNLWPWDTINWRELCQK